MIRDDDRWGINLREVNCPNCGRVMPAIRKPQSLRQFLWGGWTCSDCGCQMDKWGKPIGLGGRWLQAVRRRRVALALLGAALLMALVAWGIGYSVQTVSRVQLAVDEFHRLYHAGDYLAIYESSRPAVRQGLSRDEAVLRLSQARARLGNVVEMSYACADGHTGPGIIRIEYRVIFDNAEAWETYDWQADGETLRLLAYAVETGFETGTPDWEIVLAPDGVRPNSTTCAAEYEQLHWWRPNQ